MLTSGSQPGRTWLYGPGKQGNMAALWLGLGDDPLRAAKWLAASELRAIA